MVSWSLRLLLLGLVDSVWRGYRRPFSPMTPAVGSDILGRDVDTHHLHVLTEGPLLSQPPLVRTGKTGTYIMKFPKSDKTYY